MLSLTVSYLCSKTTSIESYAPANRRFVSLSRAFTGLICITNSVKIDSLFLPQATGLSCLVTRLFMLSINGQQE